MTNLLISNEKNLAQQDLPALLAPAEAGKIRLVEFFFISDVPQYFALYPKRGYRLFRLAAIQCEAKGRQSVYLLSRTQ